MKADIQRWTSCCIHCQCSKIRQHTKAPPSTFAMPDAHFSHAHMDIVGPLPPSKGFDYLLTCIDHFTRWVEAISIANITTKTVVHTMHQLRLTPPHISLPMLTLHSTPNLMFSSGNIPLENPYSTLTKCYPMDYKAQGVGLETCMAWVDYINCIVVSASL